MTALAKGRSLLGKATQDEWIPYYKSKNGELIAFAVNNLGKLLDVAEAAKQYVDSEEAEARAKIKCEIAECNYSNPEPEINAYTKAAVAAMDKRKALQSAIAKLEGKSHQ